MYKEHLRHFWNIHATKNRMHVLSCSSQLCACVLTRMSHERSKNIDGTELLKYYFDSAHHTDHHFLSEASALPEFGVAMPDHSEFDYRMRQNGYGIHMNTWTHGNSPSCVLLFPSTMRSCECPERWPIPALHRSRTELTHVTCSSGVSPETARAEKPWIDGCTSDFVAPEDAGGQMRPENSAGPGDREWWKSHLQVQYISVQLSIMYRPSLMNLGCQWFVGSWLTCVSCAKRIWESQTVHAVHKFQHQSILMFRLIIYDIIEHDIVTLYMTILYYTSNVIIALFTPKLAACPSWKFLRCHIVSHGVTVTIQRPCDVSFPPSAANPNRCCEDPNRWRKIHRAPA